MVIVKMQERLSLGFIGAQGANKGRISDFR
jgi:hypothetical protein